MARNATVTLCADDYGLSYGVSVGILEALKAKRLTAVSALVTGPRWPALGHELMQGRYDADVGLHFNLTLGAPLGEMPKFAPNGVFPKVSEVISASMRDKLPLSEIRSEIERQLDRFEAVMDRPPDFVDGHQHVQALPDIRDELLEALTDRRLAGKCWLRDSGDHFHRILARRAFAKKALVVRSLARGFRKAARKAGFAANDGFSGFSDFHQGKDYAKQFETYLRALGPRHLIMCHPGHADKDLWELDPVTVTREQELAFLLSDRFEEMLTKKGVTLARLSRAA